MRFLKKTRNLFSKSLPAAGRCVIKRTYFSLYEISSFLLDNSLSFLLLWNRGPLTQEVEYLPFKQRVVGSSPARPTIDPIGTLE